MSFKTVKTLSWSPILWRLCGSFDYLWNPAANDDGTLEIPGLFVIMMDSDNEKLITFGGCVPYLY